jgi:hypothetical protein
MAPHQSGKRIVISSHHSLDQRRIVEWSGHA